MTYNLRIPVDAAVRGTQSDVIQAETQGLRSFGTHGGAAAVTSLDASRIKKGEHFQDLDTYITNEDRAYWAFMRPTERPSFTKQLLADFISMGSEISSLFASSPERPFDYFVLGSRTRGIFNLGGDLPLFRKKIEERDAEGLREYGYSCNQSGYNNYIGYGQRVITISLIQGDALGGGFESALSSDLLFAERQAKFGFPEVLFNMFPGMGAYSFLSRRIGSAKAHEVIYSGNIYTAEDMFNMGAIDMVVDQDTGVQEVKRYIATHRVRQNAHSAMYEARRRVNPVTLQELYSIVDVWVDAAMRLTEQDLRKMSRIAAAQDRSRQRRFDAAMSIAAE